ncbi:uncharacterized protein METZ01_LOCUS181441 [marine metagenome]|uniref:Uncharacterized protein n=1 Tax=marine metagenome TaxID=408172 RepID=A0A382CTH7_9ZZZZ
MGQQKSPPLSYNGGVYQMRLFKEIHPPFNVTIMGIIIIALTI